MSTSAFIVDWYNNLPTPVQKWLGEACSHYFLPYLEGELVLDSVQKFTEYLPNYLDSDDETIRFARVISVIAILDHVLKPGLLDKKLEVNHEMCQEEYQSTGSELSEKAILNEEGIKNLLSETQKSWFQIRSTLLN